VVHSKLRISEQLLAVIEIMKLPRLCHGLRWTNAGMGTDSNGWE